MEHYNYETQMFEDNINYTSYNERRGEGKQLLLSPYTPEITHEMALVVLKKCNKLSAFSDLKLAGGLVTYGISKISMVALEPCTHRIQPY